MNTVAIKRKPEDELRERIANVATAATSEERRKVLDLVAEAKKGVYRLQAYDISSGMAAILFTEFNSHNRDWTASWTLELLRRIQRGLWKQINASLGMYDNGLLEDGQHRLAAVALSGDFVWQRITVQFGIKHDAISAQDSGHRRHASDHAKLDGIGNTRMKEAILEKRDVLSGASRRQGCRHAVRVRDCGCHPRAQRGARHRHRRREGLGDEHRDANPEADRRRDSRLPDADPRLAGAA